MGVFADRAADAKPAERSVPVCLRLDLMSQLQVLDRDLLEADAAARASNSLAGGSRRRELAEQVESVRAEMAQHTVTVLVRALTPRRRWTELVAKHPPREGNRADLGAGVNVDTFFDEALRACVAEPVMDDADWKALDEFGSDAQWNSLANAVWAVNTSDVDIPFSRTASRVVQESESE